MERRKREPMSEGKRNIIAGLLQEYDIRTAKDISGIEQKIISLYAKGMTTRQISETIEDIYGFEVRTCLHKKCVRIFEHKFVADKARIRRRAFARQGFLTQSAAKFAEKTCAYTCEDGF